MAALASAMAHQRTLQENLGNLDVGVAVFTSLGGKVADCRNFGRPAKVPIQQKNGIQE